MDDERNVPNPSVDAGTTEVLWGFNEKHDPSLLLRRNGRHVCALSGDDLRALGRFWVSRFNGDRMFGDAGSQPQPSDAMPPPQDKPPPGSAEGLAEKLTEYVLARAFPIILGEFKAGNVPQLVVRSAGRKAPGDDD